MALERAPRPGRLRGCAFKAHQSKRRQADTRPPLRVEVKNSADVLPSKRVCVHSPFSWRFMKGKGTTGVEFRVVRVRSED